MTSRSSGRDRRRRARTCPGSRRLWSTTTRTIAGRQLGRASGRRAGPTYTPAWTARPPVGSRRRSSCCRPAGTRAAPVGGPVARPGCRPAPMACGGTYCSVRRRRRLVLLQGQLDRRPARLPARGEPACKFSVEALQQHLLGQPSAADSPNHLQHPRRSGGRGLRRRGFLPAARLGTPARFPGSAAAGAPVGRAARHGSGSSSIHRLQPFDGPPRSADALQLQIGQGDRQRCSGRPRRSWCRAFPVPVSASRARLRVIFAGLHRKPSREPALAFSISSS